MANDGQGKKSLVDPSVLTLQSVLSQLRINVRGFYEALASCPPWLSSHTTFFPHLSHLLAPRLG